jgi:hypothetical protein
MALLLVAASSDLTVVVLHHRVSVGMVWKRLHADTQLCNLSVTTVYHNKASSRCNKQMLYAAWCGVHVCNATHSFGQLHGSRHACVDIKTDATAAACRKTGLPMHRVPESLSA